MPRRSKNIQPWQRLGSETVYTCRIFSLRKDRNRSPRDGREHDFFVLDSGDWVNIVPVTPDDQVVLIHQYRHGIDDITLEIPGGMVDPHDPSPLHAARREMHAQRP
ncbi:MAG: NUDIX hydrolase [Deltaproteobacteria bacterium]|nr:NUDIX hydrolase [Deltaproteobacteria bacterium]